MYRRIALSAATIVLALGSVVSVRSQATKGALADRLGSDDGFALVVDFSGDMNGDIDNCGCKSKLMGGVVWRAGYVEALSKATKGEIPILQVDAGHSLAPDPDEFEGPGDNRVKNDYVLRAFEHLRLDAANVSHHDLAHLAERMRASTVEKSRKEFPALDVYTSGNVVPLDATTAAFKPYIVREVRGARLGSSPLRVGFLGLSETPVTGSGPNRDIVGYYRVTNAMEAAKKLVPELRAKCDVLVVLAYMDKGPAKAIAESVPGIDVVLAANQFGYSANVDEAASALIAYATTQTKWLGELRFYAKSSGASRQLSNILYRPVALDSVIPEDATAAKLVEAARTAAQKARPRPAGAD